jgi:hypothetical protein
MKLFKKYCLFLFVLAIAFLGSCNSKKDYNCTLAAGTVVTNPDGTQYTVTDTETKACEDCTTKDVQALTDKGYTCN